MRTTYGLCILALLAACGGDGGSTTVNVPPGSTITQGDGSTLSVVPVQPPNTTTCDTTVNQTTGAPLNVFCDSSGNVVAAGPVTQDSNNGNPIDNNNSNNRTTTTNNNPEPTPTPRRVQ